MTTLTDQPTVDTALLTYAWHTNPSPLLVSASVTNLASASLTLVVSCSEGFVTVRQIEVQIPADPPGATPDPTGLAATAPTLASIVSNGTDVWKVNAGDEPGSFLFTPTSGTVAVGTQSLTISIPQVQVSTLVGTAVVTVNEWAAVTGAPPDVSDPPSGTAQTPLPKFPQGFAVNWFDATTPAVGPDYETVLSWSGSAGATYTIQYDDVTIPDPNDRHAVPLSPEGSLKVDQLQNDPTLFTLTVTAQENGATATLVRQALVAVKRAKITKFSAYPDVVGKGASVTVSWVTNGDTVLLGDAQVTAPSAAQPLVVTDSVDLTLTAWKGEVGSGDMTQAQAHVEVVPPVINAFAASLAGVPVAAPILTGSAVTFTWQTTYAQTVAISPTVGTVGAKSDPGTPRTATVVNNTTFVLTCTGKGDPVTRSVAIVVIPTLTVGIGNVDGQPHVVWSSQGATRVTCQVSGVGFPNMGPSDRPTSGNMFPYDNEYDAPMTYTFVAYNDGAPPVTAQVTYST